MYRSLSTAAALSATLLGAPSALAMPHPDGVPDAHARRPLSHYERALRAARHEYRVSYREARRRFGVQALGRNIARDGVRRPHGARAAHVSELRESTARLRAMLAPVRAHVTAPATPPSYIAQCESGGDPTAVSPDGLYRGKWQMDQRTWESAGGTGDPAAAPEAVQDAVAATLYARRGTQPWAAREASPVPRSGDDASGGQPPGRRRDSRIAEVCCPPMEVDR
jgi:hypothetical protein